MPRHIDKVEAKRSYLTEHRTNVTSPLKNQYGDDEYRIVGGKRPFKISPVWKFHQIQSHNSKIWHFDVSIHAHEVHS